MDFEVWYREKYGRDYDREDYLSNNVDEVTNFMTFDGYTQEEAELSVINNIYDTWGSDIEGKGSMRLKKCRTCDGCKALTYAPSFGVPLLSCDLQYKMNNRVPLEPCPKPRTNDELILCFKKKED